MTIATTGPLRLGRDIRNEYAGPTSARLWRDFRRGTVYLKANAANNQGVNGSANVPSSGPIRFSHYRGAARGYTFTNTVNRITSGDHVWIHPFFGDDWNGNDWPKTFVNNAGMFSTSVNYYPVVIYQGQGIITFINNGDVQAAGGVGAVYGVSGATGGQHALVITQCTTKPRIINNTYLAGGGGGGGWGGAGGTGGQGYYVYTAQEGPTYGSGTWVVNQNPYQVTTGQGGGTHNEPGYCRYYWGGGLVASPSSGTTAVAVGGITYYRYTFVTGQVGGGGVAYYQIYRQFAANAYTGGGGGGVGGNGGRGIGYNTPNAGGTGGAAGAGGGTNAGAGGTGGTGGTGGSWGGTGNTGNTGAGGGYGNYTGWGSGGAGGSGGGAGGAAIYSDSAWSLVVGGTLYGSYVGTAPT